MADPQWVLVSSSFLVTLVCIIRFFFNFAEYTAVQSSTELSSFNKRGVLIHKKVLAFCQLVSSRRRVTHSDVSFLTKYSEVLGHCWLYTPHIHTSEWDSLFFQSCLLSTVTVTPSDSDCVNRSAFIQRFWLIHTTPSRRSRVRMFAFVPRSACAPGSRLTKPLETVATKMVTSISYCILFFCERCWLAGVPRWCWCYVWWHTLFFINCFGIELVLCDFKLYLTRFVLGLLFDTFFLVVFLQLCRCDHWVFKFE